MNWNIPSRSRSTSALRSSITPARGARCGRNMCDRLPPCNHACPAGEDIQGWLRMPRAANTKPPGAR